MDKLQLALLTQWAEDAGLGGIDGRKRMQKVVYFLQQAGCPIDADYALHFYGPYSRDVAEVTDVMVAEKLLDEQAGNSYRYTLNAQTRPLIELTCQRHPDSADAFKAYKDRAVELLRAELPVLELGSTILFMFKNDREGPKWERALAAACRYKDKNEGEASSQLALDLAKRFASA